MLAMQCLCSLLKPVLPKGIALSIHHRELLRRLTEELCCTKPAEAEDGKFSATCTLMRQAAVS